MRQEWRSRKGRPVAAAKSAHSAALPDRLRNINLQHYRPRKERYPQHTVNSPTRVPHQEPGWQPVRLEWIPKDFPPARPPPLGNSITNLFISMENHRRFIRHIKASISDPILFRPGGISLRAPYLSQWRMLNHRIPDAVSRNTAPVCT